MYLKPAPTTRRYSTVHARSGDIGYGVGFSSMLSSSSLAAAAAAAAGRLATVITNEDYVPGRRQRIADELLLRKRVFENLAGGSKVREIHY